MEANPTRDIRCRTPRSLRPLAQRPPLPPPGLGPVGAALATVHPIVLSHGRNALVWDSAGREYIDFVGGIGVLNLGHCHPAVVAAVAGQAQRLIHSAYNAVPHQGYGELMEALADFVAVGYPLAGMLTNSGAEAVENALKIVRAATGRSAVIAFDGGFHGRTLAALNLNGKVVPYKQGVGPLPGPVYHVPYPSQDTGVDAQTAFAAIARLLEVEIDAGEVGCFVVEPILGDGGFQALDPAFACRLRSFCDERGIVLVVDEIQSGFGRTGRRFAFHRLGIEPDLLLLGKSIAGGLPLGAVVGRRELLDSLPQGGLGGTYSGNPLACAAALASLRIMTDANLAAWGQAQEHAVLRRHAHWRRRALSPCLGRLTGVGAMRGIELTDPQGAPGTWQLATLLQRARDRGLLLMPSGRHRHIVRLLAPLTIEPELFERGLDIIESCLADLG
ncbi:aminotransferase class III-fold pyridoxal phosphate-dependent enzyme [Xanthomonas hyacinthi]|uniref:4-aminobutyrate aminotransferase n=2 Tax=Xanthomonas hyacinthi TaxID=56455 RepID=A0A2S7EX77_9XANT|nr:4-aminobutyrate aminotransferase [Xanthomonas hyacinthi]QGY77078.1 aminotransferase class III-fold pyridoxal phosphate-dependent enzyme [Xanthomonas hyacinthi]